MNKDTGTYEAIIIGSGLGGLAAAHRLLESGCRKLLILERHEEYGGTWCCNSYPGAAVDVQSHLYSLSFAPYDWSRQFADRDELYTYTRHVARAFGLEPYIRTRSEVKGLAYHEPEHTWTVNLEDGRTFHSVSIINATGILSQPNIPEFSGVEEFEGRMMHTSRWDHQVCLDGSKVAVIGSGASAVQVVPAIAGRVSQLYVFQRTPNWILPKPDRPFRDIERWLFRRIPVIRKLYRKILYAVSESRVLAFRHPGLLVRLFQRKALSFLKKNIPDPELREKLTPDYKMGCKRVLLSNDYYASLLRSNVHLVAGSKGLRRFSRTGVITGDGREIDVDTVIFATGFHAAERNIPYPVSGRNGQLLTSAWSSEPFAYLGTTVPGFPNFFMLAGPNTSTGHTSALGLLESQIQYIVGALDFRDQRNAGAVEVKAEAAEAYDKRIQRMIRGTVWENGGCKSWYQSATGRITALYPTFTFHFNRDCRRFRPGDHQVSGLHHSSPPLAASSGA